MPSLFKSVRGLILVSVALGVVAGYAVLITLQTVDQYDRSYKNAIDGDRHFTALLAREAGTAIRRDSSEELERLYGDAVNSEGSTIAGLSAVALDGHRVKSFVSSDHLTLDEAMVERAAQNAARLGQRQELTSGDLFIVAVPAEIGAQHEIAGALAIAWDISPAETQARSETYQQVSIALLISLGVLGALLIVLEHAVLRPLTQISDAIKKLAGGNMNYRVPGLRRASEFGNLARAVEVFRLHMVEIDQLRSEQDEYLQTVFRTAVDGIAVLDANGTVEALNPAAERLFGYHAKEVIHRNFGKLVPDLSEDPGPEAMRAFLASVRSIGIGIARETDGLRRDGSRFTMHLAVSDFSTATGPKFTAIIHDISELKRAEEVQRQAREAAESANRIKSEFLANMSHELRTPLNAIIGYSEMLVEESEGSEFETFVPDLSKIRNAGKHLLSLINDILDISKIEAGKMELFIEPFEAEGMIRDVVATIKPLIDKNSNRLNVELGPDLGMLTADLTKVRQSLFNLLSNASKFTENGTIILGAERVKRDGQDWFVFRIRDSGIGMTPDQLSRLFQAFSQADASTTRKYGGTGLGLVITRTFCTMMGGTITATSAQGQGSEFVVTLPAVVEMGGNQTTTPPRPTPTGALVAGNGSLILVIDDDRSSRDVLQRFLVEAGYAVRTATHGEEGLRMARLHKPAVILLDVMMPGMDGWAVLTALKADPDLADIPVVMETMVDDRALGFALGASQYIVKPVSRDRLVAVLRQYRNLRPLHHALVVEDDPTTREMMRRMLEREGLPVVEAENGRVALERIRQKEPDIILLDLMMPEMDGFELANELRKNEQWRKIPVVVLTAKDLTQEDRQRLTGNVQRIFQKGAVDRDVMLADIHHLVKTVTERPSSVAVE